METTLAILSGSLMMGAAIAVLALFCRDWFAAGLGFVEKDLAEKLRRLRAPRNNLRKYLVVWWFAVVGTFIFFWLAMGSLIFAVLAAAFLVSAPWYLVRRMAEKHRLKVDDQLADSMVTLANAVKAGLSLPQALEILASQCPKPINAEFRQMVGEYQMGKPLEQVLTETKDRLRSENFALFAAAMLASHDSGGRLNETIERIATSVREMQRLERKVLSETAQARKSAVYMALAPAVILLVYYFVDPIATTLLFTTLADKIILVIVVLLNTLAYFWARMILNPDI